MAQLKERDLREACVEEALSLIGEVGVEGLSIREVARRLGVSHQAPYKHFASSDHLLAEIVRRTFAKFSAYLKKMGIAYFEFAMNHPLHYRLMFGTALPPAAEHPEMMEEARAAFSLLFDAVARAHGRHAKGKPLKSDQLDALFVWATVHGLSTILQSTALEHTGLAQSVLKEALPHTLASIGKALGDHRAN
jgi:AcrR family transcriptional regulator